MLIRDAIDRLNEYVCNSNYGPDSTVEFAYIEPPSISSSVSISYHIDCCDEYRRKIKLLEELAEVRAFRLQQIIDLVDSFR